jgi:hypothetical protein
LCTPTEIPGLFRARTARTITAWFAKTGPKSLLTQPTKASPAPNGLASSGMRGGQDPFLSVAAWIGKVISGGLTFRASAHSLLLREEV